MAGGGGREVFPQRSRRPSEWRIGDDKNRAILLAYMQVHNEREVAGLYNDIENKNRE